MVAELGYGLGRAGDGGPGGRRDGAGALRTDAVVRIAPSVRCADTPSPLMPDSFPFPIAPFTKHRRNVNLSGDGPAEPGRGCEVRRGMETALTRRPFRSRSGVMLHGVVV